MTSFKIALEHFQLGKIDLLELEAALDHELLENPNRAQEISTELRGLLDGGRLNNFVHTKLQRRIGTSQVNNREGRGTGEQSTGKDQTRANTRPTGELSMPASHTSPPSITGDLSERREQGAGAGDGHTVVIRGRSGHTSRPRENGNFDAPTKIITTKRTTEIISSLTIDPGAEEDGPPPAKGSVLNRKYRLEELIGRGGFGEVFKARDLLAEEGGDQNPFVAIKLLNEKIKSDEDALGALLREVKDTPPHPNIVRVHTLERDGSNVYMVMELLDGRELKEVIKRNRNGLSVDDALSIVEGLGAGLGYAHSEGLIHSDFKPGNAWLTANDIPKVLDFGIARRASGGKGKALRAFTEEYASLEMLRHRDEDRDPDPDPRDDVYALACVTYELLTGHHPFDKKSADEAQKLGLKPPPIKGLSRRQYRGLLRGLAFEREHRSPSVEEFLQGIRPLQVQKSLIAASALGIVILVILLGYFLPSYLEQRTLKDLMKCIRTGDATQIERCLVELKSLDRDQLGQVLLPADVQTRFIDFYTAQVQAAFDPSQERFDYAQAANLVNQLKDVDPLSNDLRVRDLQQNTFKRFNDEYNRSIEEGILIQDQGPRNAIAIVAAMAMINPDPEEQLSESDLIPDFVSRAESAYKADKIALAKALVAKGLEIAPDNGSLINLNAQILAKDDERIRKEHIATAESQLADKLPNVTQLTDFKTLIITMQHLLALDPTNSTLVEARDTLLQLIATETNALAASRDFDTAESRLDEYAPALSPEALRPLRDQVATARTAFEVEIESLNAAFRQAIDAGRLGADVQNNAEDALTALEKAAAPAHIQSAAWSVLIEAYIRSATDKRDAGEFQSARDIINEALALQPESSLKDQLARELQQISIIEKAGIEERIQMAKDKLEKLLKEPDLEARDVEDLFLTLNYLEEAQAAAPNDRSNAIERVVTQAKLLAGREEYEAALALLQIGQRVEPDETNFSAPIEDIRLQQLKKVQDRLAQELADAREALEGVLKKRLFANREWRSQLQQTLAEVEKLATSRDSTTRERIAEAFIQEAAQQRKEKHLDEAADLLKVARSYESELPALITEQDALEQARHEIERERWEAEVAASVARLKRSVSANARDGDAVGAEKKFNELREELSQDDPYIRELLAENDAYIKDEGPRLIADAFVAGAQDALNKERPEQAGKLADRALSYVPAHAEAVKIISELGPLLALLKLKNDFAEAIKKDKLEDAELILKELRSKLPAEDAFATEEGPKKLAEAYVSRGKSALSLEEFDEAKRNADHALALVDDYAPALTLKELIKKVEPRTDEQCGRSGLVGAGPRATCRDSLSDGSNGPSMVVIPPGGAFSRPFAIGKYEITVKEFNHYCRASGECASIKGSTDTVPATGIAIADAERMASWLSEQTEWRYRLPTSDEWLWAARADGQPQKGDLNCLVGNPGNPTKGAMLRDVRSGDPNGWGLQESVGNAREWTKDGGNIMANGGARTDRLEACRPELSISHGGEADEVTGFRLVREIGG